MIKYFIHYFLLIFFLLPLLKTQANQESIDQKDQVDLLSDHRENQYESTIKNIRNKNLIKAQNE